MTPHILIIGGTGVFGKRLVRHLAKRSGISLYVSSRSLSKGQAFVRTLPGAKAVVHPIALDCRANLKEVLADVQPFAVVDCSGSFQKANYDTARAVLEAGAHLVDLADARDYLASYADALDQTARDHIVAALTGASSTPMLSTAVAKHVTQDWRRVDTIDIAITPGGKSEVGQSVIEAILSYAGKDVPIWAKGKLSRVTGWGWAKKVDMPGLGPRRVAAVETFDAEHLGPRLNVQSRVSFSAGLESKVEQFGIELIAALRKRRLIGPPQILIPWLLKARSITRIPTSDCGGMLVDICGLNADGVQTQCRWSLVAKQDHGPFIPILPAAAAVEKLLSVDAPPGAGVAHMVVTLPDILHEMQSYEIHTETTSTQIDHSPFEAALWPDDFEVLPHALKQFHTSSGPVLWSGQADVDCGRWFAPKMITRLFGFPKAGRNIPVTVSIDRKRSKAGAAVETWTRSFAETEMSSDLQLLGNSSVTECFAPFTVEMGLRVDPEGLRMPVLGWRLGPIRLPKILAPKSETLEYMDEKGRFRFDVRLSAPLIGLIAHYRGWLMPVQD